MSQRPDLSKLTREEKDAVIYALLDQVEALRAEVAARRVETGELKRRLGLDSSNSGKPPSRDGYRKKPRVVNLREKTGKKSGGQDGHDGKTLRQTATPDKIVDHYPPVCTGCGQALGLEQATSHRKRQVFDVPKACPVEVTEHRAHWCRCPGCGEDSAAAFPDGVLGLAQYGTNVAALVVYLQPWQLLAEDRGAELLCAVFGVDLSCATLAAMAQRKAEEWAGLAGLTH